MKTEQFLLKKQSFFTVQLKNLTRKQKKTPRGFYAAFFTTVFRVVEKLCAVFKFIFAAKKLFNPAQVALTRKMLRNEAKIYQETDFLSTKRHSLTSPGCSVTLTSLLDVVQVDLRLSRFFNLISKLCSFAKGEWFPLSSSKLRRGRFLGRLVGSFFALCFVVLTVKN